MTYVLTVDAKSVIEKDQNGRPVFRARFNVKDYQPEEVNVKMDGDRIIVHAEHQEKDGTKSVSREFSREVNIPREVDPLLLQCTIGRKLKKSPLIRSISDSHSFLLISMSRSISSQTLFCLS
jgi:hypothetical protein